MRSATERMLAIAAAAILPTTGARAECLDDIRKAGVIKSGNGMLMVRPPDT